MKKKVNLWYNTNSVRLISIIILIIILNIQNSEIMCSGTIPSPLDNKQTKMNNENHIDGPIPYIPPPPDRIINSEEYPNYWNLISSYQNVPEYSWHYGCSPTAAGMLFGWWDSQAETTNIFDGSASTWWGDTTESSSGGTKSMVASTSHIVAGDENGYTYGDWHNSPSYPNHESNPKCLADFMKTKDGGTSRSNMAAGFENYAGWDVSWTGTDESYSATATTYYTSSGWTFNDFKNEINQGYPVHLGITKHSILAFGWWDQSTPGDPDNYGYICYTTWSGWGMTEWRWDGQGVPGDRAVYGATYLRVQPKDDAYEENDNRGTAYDISSHEQTWLRNINGYGIQADDDWYEIYISSGYEHLDVDLTFTHADGDIDIAVIDSGGNHIVSSQSSTNNEYISFDLPSSGTYYLWLYYGDMGNNYDLWWDDTQPSPQLSRTPPSINFGTMGQGQTDSSAFYITNSGGGTLSWSVSESLSWISKSPSSGTTTSETDTIQVNINTAGLSGGLHSGTISISSNGGSSTVSVSVAIDTTPPTLSITDPSNNDHITGTHNIRYSTSVDTSSILFQYNDGSWHTIGTDNSIDGSFNWNTGGLNLQGVTLRGTATDGVGLQGTDSVTGVEIDNTNPTLSITAPSNNEHITGACTIEYNVDADTQNILFEYNDGSWHTIGMDNSIDGSFNWNAGGLNLVGVTLRGTAVDDAGLQGSDSIIGLELDNTNPTLSITSPSNNEHMTGIYTIEYTCDADTQSILFEYNNGNWHTIGTDNTIDGSFNWNTSGMNLVGVTLRGTATDDVGLEGTDTVTGLEIDNTNPTFNITSPSNNEHITGTYLINYTTDVDVQSIIFEYNDGSWHTIGTDNTIDGSFNWNTGGLDLVGVTLRATATDDVGLQGTDSVTGIEIDNTNPTLTITSPSNNEHITGIYKIDYSSDVDTRSILFEYNNGSWHTIGTDNTIDGSFNWNTGGMNMVDVILRGTATDDVGLHGMDSVTGLEIDNTNPIFTITSPSNNEHITGTYTINYTTDVDVQSVIFEYNDGSWHTIGTDNTIDGSFNWNTGGLDLIGVTLRGNATDDVGLQGTDSITGIEIDNTNPTLTITSPSNNEHITGIHTINYTVDADTQSILFEYNNGSWHTIGTDNTIDGSFAWNTGGMNLVGVTLRGMATDDVGLQGMDSVTGLEIDNTNPIFTITSPSNNEHITGTYTINYTADVDVQSVIFEYNDGSWHTFGVDSTIDGTFIWNTSGLNLIGITIKGTATDDVGLQGTDSISGVEIDNTCPTLTITSPSNNEHITGIYTLNYTVDTDTQSILFEYYNGSWHEIGTDNTIDGSFSWNTSGMDCKGVVMRGSAIDDVGLYGNNSVTGIEIDNTAPTLDITEPRVKELVMGVVTVRYSVDVDTKHILFEYNDGIWHTVGTDSGITGQFFWDTTGLDISNVTFRGVAIDEVGLTGECLITGICINNAPDLLIFDPLANDHITGICPIRYITSEDTVSISFDYNDGNGQGWRSIGMDSTINGTYYWDTVGMDVSRVTVRGIARDNYGLQAIDTVRSIEIDNLKPTLSIKSPSEGANLSGYCSIEYNVDEDVEHILFEYYDGIWHAIGTDDTIDGYFLWDTSGLNIPNVMLRGTAVDEVLLRGNCTVEEMEIDNTYPSTLVFSPVENQHITGTIEISYITDQDTRSIFFEYYNKTWKDIGTDYLIDGSFVWDTHGLNIGVVSLRCTTTDDAGLSSICIISGIEIDNTKPTIAIHSPLAGEHITNYATIEYTVEEDTKNILFEYYDGIWHVIGTENTIDGSFIWDTSGLDISNIIIRGTAKDDVGLTGNDTVKNIEIDNILPMFIIRSPISNEHINGKCVLTYTVDSDVEKIIFEYYDGSWHNVGIDTTIDGSFTWDTSGLNLTGLIVKGTAIDDVGQFSTYIINGVEIDNNPPMLNITSPRDNEYITGIYNINYTTDEDVISILFEYFDGRWHIIGTDNNIDGSYMWDTNGLDLSNVSIRGTAIDDVRQNGKDIVRSIGIDNTAPSIIITTPKNNEIIAGNCIITYTADIDIDRILFEYNDGTWHVIGTDLIINGTFHWDTSNLNCSIDTIRCTANDKCGLSNQFYVNNVEINKQISSTSHIPSDDDGKDHSSDSPVKDDVSSDKGVYSATSIIIIVVIILLIISLLFIKHRNGKKLNKMGSMNERRKVVHSIDDGEEEGWIDDGEEEGWIDDGEDDGWIDVTQNEGCFPRENVDDEWLE